MTVPALTQEDVEGVITDVTFHVIPGTLITVCNLVTRNGAVVEGRYAGSNPMLYDRERDEGYAREVAMGELWRMEAYVQKERQYQLSRRADVHEQLNNAINALRDAVLGADNG